MNNKRVLVVAAHPDDEVLGCGGTVRKWHECGAKIEAVILAQGIASRGGEAGDSLREKIELLRMQAKKSAELADHISKLFGYF